MPQRIIGVSKRLIEVAKKEFLENGFEGASIRTIAREAQTSPRAVYTRFENKEELFAAVIEPVYSDFIKMFKNDKIIYWERARQKDFSTNPEDFYLRYLDYAYQHKEQFFLVLKQSKGTRFENFTQYLCEIDLAELNKQLPQLLENFKQYQKDQSTKLFLSTITYSFYDALFAPLVHGVELEVAKAYITKLTRFYNDGILAGIK
ncbi:MAG: TetR/AcrR family transcriptional regulator [Treponema sp.]|nr:TetR/AcrR family transcriptional regulator [Treponema sp.]